MLKLRKTANISLSSQNFVILSTNDLGFYLILHWITEKDTKYQKVRLFNVSCFLGQRLYFLLNLFLAFCFSLFLIEYCIFFRIIFNVTLCSIFGLFICGICINTVQILSEDESFWDWRNLLKLHIFFLNFLFLLSFVDCRPKIIENNVESNL